jgi:uncharacterized membrane protein YjgN (DUF898 family)
MTQDFTPMVAHSAPAPERTRLAVAFTGSGWEYFRIWLVNLVLTVLTLGIYYPWARVRKLRYIYANTTVDGDALTYHATGWQLFKGMVVAGLIFGAINLMAALAPALAVLSGLAFWLLLPWFWSSAMRFRLRQSSWRGVRFGFRGSIGGAYSALGGGALVLIASLVAVALSLTWVEGGGASPAMVLLLSAGGAAAVAAAWSLLVLRMRRYQHNHYAFGDLTVTMDVTWSQVWRASLAGLLVGGLLFVVLVAVGILGLAGVGSLINDSVSEREQGAIAGLAILWVLGLIYLTYPLVTAYVGARYQNLFWGATRHRLLQVHSDLSPWRLVGLVLVNLILTALTLGLYWPFAAVKVLRLRLAAMSLESELDWAGVHAVATAGNNSLGDMAMEVEGVDFGF